MRLTIICISCLFFISKKIYSQSLVNKEWENNHGNPLGMDWTNSKTNKANELLHVGNTFVAQEGADVKTTKYDNNGLALWEAVYNSQENFNDYGIALEEDSQGNIYVLGTTDNNNTATNFDILLLKYGNNGALLWSTSFNSSFDKNDVGTDLKLDENGNIYVCAVSEVSAGNQDYLILKYTNNGTLIWSNRYDYAALSDIPIGIDFDINGDIFFTGASASSLNNWDFTIARFSSLGNLTGDARFPLPGIGFDQPLAFRKDIFNNTYITGRTSTDGINYDIKTIKLNPSFVVQWERTLDFEGKNDEGQAIDIDENGNVYIGGFVSKANNIKEAIVVKYDANGNEIWNKKYKGSDVSADAMIKSLKAKNNDEIYILGEEKGNNGTKDAVVSKLNGQGGVNWQKKVTSTADDKPKAIHVSNNGNVFVSLIKNGQLNEYSNIKFNEYNKGKEVVLSPSGKPLYVAHELVVRFHQNALKTAAIDNTIGSKVAVFGDLDYFLRPNALLSFNDAFKNLCVENKNSTIANPCGIKVVKIFKELKTTTTTTTNRLGDIINIPDFWTTLLLVFPPEVDIQHATEALKSIPSVSVYSEPNYIIELTSPPNDPLYNLQTSLFYETFQDDDTAHINMQEAWGIVPKG